MKEIDVFRDGVKVCVLPITESNATYTKRLMGEENIVIEYSTTDLMIIKSLDYIVYENVRYTLWATPTPKIGDGNVADYSLVFFAPYYFLYNKKLKHTGANGSMSDIFSYSGYPINFAELIINSINSVDTGWTIGVIEDLGFRTVEFNDNSCYTGLTKICEAYKCEFDFSNKVLSIKKNIGTDTVLSFSYGKGKGLYELTVQELSNSSIITHLEVFGGTTNMDKGTRLQLTAPLKKNIDKYGLREDKVIFEYIFPRLKDKTIIGVTVPSDITVAKKWGVNIDITFDLSKCVIAGLTPQLQFQSGELMGLTFDLASISENNRDIDWDNITKHCYIIVKEDGGYRFPSVTRQPKVGDKFVLLNIAMDQSYITDALTELNKEGKKYHDSVCVPQLVYSLDIDQRYIKTHSLSINIGDKITVLDAKRSINDKIRVTIKKYPLNNPNDLDLTISSEVLYESSEKVQVQIEKNSQITAIHDDDIRMQYLELKRIDKEAKRIKNSLGPVLDRLSYNEKNNTLVSSVTLASAAAVVMFGAEGGTEGGGGGVMEHNLLFNRDLPDQHPLSSITGLTKALSEKSSTWHTHNYLSSITKQMVEEVLTGNITTHIHSIYALLNGLSTEDFSVKSLKASDVGYFEKGVVMFGTEGGTGGGVIGTLYHDLLENRNIANQHTIEAITNLQSILDGKISDSDLRLTDARTASDVYTWAKAAAKPTYTAAEVGALSLGGGTLTGSIRQDISVGQTVIGRDHLGMYIDSYYNGINTCQLRLFNNSRLTYYSSLVSSEAYDIWTSYNFNPSTKVDVIGGKANYLQWLNPDGSFVPSHYLKYVRTNPLTATGRLYLQAGDREFDAVQVYFSTLSDRANGADKLWAIDPLYRDVYYQYLEFIAARRRWKIRVNDPNPPWVEVDYALCADELYAPDRGFGDLKIGTSMGLINGFPTSVIPAIRTKSYLYFSTDEKYHLAIGYNMGKTEFYNGLSDGFRFTAPIQCTGAIVMYSTI